MNDRKAEQKRIERANQAREEFGLSELRFDSESVAPEVDWEILRSFANGELPQDISVDIRELIENFHSWNEAYSQILQGFSTDDSTS